MNQKYIVAERTKNNTFVIHSVTYSFIKARQISDDLKEFGFFTQIYNWNVKHLIF